MTMLLNQGCKTSVGLLRRAADWGDAIAWARLVDTYESMIRSWCRPLLAGDEEAIDEVTQVVWIELARRLKDFQYDESRTFRGWLHRLVVSRALDQRRKARRGSSYVLLEDEAIAPFVETPDDIADSLEFADRLALAVEVVEAVRSRVHETSWRAFQLRVIRGLTLDETAVEVGKSFGAASNAVYRVADRLRIEGARLLAEKNARREADR